MKTPHQTTPEQAPEKKGNIAQWAAIIVLAITVLGYALISYGRQEKTNETFQDAINKLQQEKVDREVFRVTVESVNTRLKDIKDNTDKIPDIKATIDAHISKDKR